ncbi:MAG TPA: hypothetical protein VNX88_20120 [Terriglobales bacterium]|jgi:hypothetical protein|nr:hypothetical protein [Terriglobales bacterium]
MFFKTPLAFAVVAAISASLMALLGGLFALGIYGGLVRFAVIPAVSHFNLSGLVVFVVAVFGLSLPIETVYARRRLFSKEGHHGAKPAFLLFPVAIAVAICSRVIGWRRSS